VIFEFFCIIILLPKKFLITSKIILHIKYLRCIGAQNLVPVRYYETMFIFYNTGRMLQEKTGCFAITTNLFIQIIYC